MVGGNLKSQSKRSNAILLLSAITAAVFFQNCAAAGPPDLSSLSQASTQPLPPGGSGAPLSTPTPTPPPTPVITPPPTAPPVSQTYSWSVGAWSSCLSGSKTRSVICVSNLGTVVSNTFCTATMSLSSQACSTFACTATLTPGSEFFPSGFCTYTCVASATYHAFANDPLLCSPSPIGVAGTETMFTADFAQTMARPFSQCTVTRNFANTANGYTGESVCD